MNKWLFLFVVFSHQCMAQSIDSVSFPNKYYFIGFLNPSPKVFELDTADIGYSTVQYHSFSTNGQMIKATHNQSFTDFLDVKLDITKFSQEGIFLRENLKLYDLNSLFLFTNKKKNYSAKAMLTYQKIRMDENGGLSSNASINIDEPKLNLVNLSFAQNLSKNRYHSFSQTFSINDKYSLVNSISILKRQKTYTDNFPAVGFYQHVFLDSTQTNDSISNEFLNGVVGFKFNHFTVSYLLFRRYFSNNHIDTADIDNGMSIKYESDNQNSTVDFKFYQSGEYNLKLDKAFGNKHNHHFLIVANRQRAPIFYNTYISNHYQFQNNFEFQSAHSFTYKYKSPYVTLTSLLKHHTNYLFLDESSQAKQFSTSILHISNELTTNWKLANFKGAHTLQHQWTDQQSVIRLPSFSASSTVWYENSLFDASLRLKMGFKAHYFTPYLALAYNPSLASFHLQNETEIGGYPLVDAFVNFQISNMNVNVQFQNLGYQLMDKPYYFVPNYIGQPGLIKLSLVWKLLNS